MLLAVRATDQPTYFFLAKYSILYRIARVLYSIPGHCHVAYADTE